MHRRGKIEQVNSTGPYKLDKYTQELTLTMNNTRKKYEAPIGTQTWTVLKSDIGIVTKKV